MKRTTFNLLLAATLLLSVLTLSACVRPVPGSKDPATQATATPDLIIQPTVAPALTPIQGVTPTPDGAASPTPPPVEATLPPPVEQATATPEQPGGGQVDPATGDIIHTVQPGENLFRIGLRYGFTAQELAAYNGIPNVNLIFVGDQIRIPPKP